MAIFGIFGKKKASQEEVEQKDLALEEGLKKTKTSIFSKITYAIAGKSIVDDDVLDVRVLHARGPRYRAVASLAFGRRTAAVARALHLMPRSSDIERRLVRELTLAVLPVDGSIPVFVHDGELETRLDEDADGRYEISFRMIPSDLRVYA